MNHWFIPRFCFCWLLTAFALLQAMVAVGIDHESADQDRGYHQAPRLLGDFLGEVSLRLSRPEVLQVLPAELIEEAEFCPQLSLPSASETFCALSKHGRPNWRNQFQRLPTVKFNDRVQLALSLGILKADCSMAVESRDIEQVACLSHDSLTLIAALGLKPAEVLQGSTYTELAEDGEWQKLREQISKTHEAVTKSLSEQHDEPLILLMNAGSWLRSVQICSALVEQEYEEAKTRILVQADVADGLVSALQALPEDWRKRPLLRDLVSCLEDLSVTMRADVSAARSAEEAVGRLASRLPEDVVNAAEVTGVPYLSQPEVNKLHRLTTRFITKATER